jgi:outer membrane protein assembly factor BamB
VSGNTLYIAGNFTTVGTASRTNVAAIDIPTGTVLPFAATPSARVASVDVAGGVVYIGGTFTKVNGTRMPYLAGLDATSGALISTFSPKPSAQVLVVKATSTSLYVGGNFQTIAGVARNYVAQLDFSGNVLPWDAGLGFDSRVFNIAFDPTDATAVYLAAGGHLPNGNSVYRIDAATGAHIFQVQVDGDVHGLVVTNGTVYAGGHFNFLKPCDSSGVCTPGAKRRKAIAISALTGQVLDWAPNFNSSLGIFNMNVADGNLYAFGDFTTVNGKSHPHIARFTSP